MRALITLCLLLVAFSGLAQRSRKEKNSAASNSSKVALEKGELKDGKPVGIWEYYDSNGVLDLKMDYDFSRIVYSRPDTARYLLKVGNEWQQVQPSRAPRVMGSPAKRLQDIGRTLRYPVPALSQRREGVVLLSYEVNEQGQTTNYLIEKSTGKEFDQAVWQAIKDERVQWIPAVYLGQPRAAKFYFSVVFRIIGSSQEDAQPDAPKESVPPYVSQWVIRASTR